MHRVSLGVRAFTIRWPAPLVKLSVRAWSDDVLLEEHELAGSDGDLSNGSFAHDRITAVEFAGDDAALVELCYGLVRKRRVVGLGAGARMPPADRATR